MDEEKSKERERREGEKEKREEGERKRRAERRGKFHRTRRPWRVVRTEGTKTYDDKKKKQCDEQGSFMES